MRASYTLQFADGTGSDPNAAARLIATDQPNLRTIYPYNYDQRHQIIVASDYRYGSGKNYNGPRIAGKEIFKNTGANLVANLPRVCLIQNLKLWLDQPCLIHKIPFC